MAGDSSPKTGQKTQPLAPIGRDPERVGLAWTNRACLHGTDPVPLSQPPSIPPQSSVVGLPEQRTEPLDPLVLEVEDGDHRSWSVLWLGAVVRGQQRRLVLVGLSSGSSLLPRDARCWIQSGYGEQALEEQVQPLPAPCWRRRGERGATQHGGVLTPLNTSFCPQKRLWETSGPDSPLPLPRLTPCFASISMRRVSPLPAGL
ncbi:hypothetical protein NHX12_023938 [Muraenolepis orangiensis]|uniref:Uncharacterized protein n=1 Tax=Muraenolepis orangiensis TaxID=630683 RepID=A0A9Q0IQK8_9TELE|nr:hypothetical protein NHX12_023938 [Muraenolepis orangiensis]